MYRAQVIGLSVRHAGKVFALLLAILAVTSAALFLARRWIPAAASLHAPVLDAQLHWTLIDIGIIFLTAQLALAAFVWKFHARANQQTRSFPSGTRVAIIVAVAFIGLELFSAGTLGRRAWASMYGGSEGADAVTVEAMGQQFAFYFRYPGEDGKFGPIHVDKIDPSIANYFGLDRVKDSASKDDVVSAELALPLNHPVDLVLGAQDVVHSFYIRELRIQQDMVPGMRIPVHFTPTKIGKYEIVCTQLCGLGHYRMRAYLRVMSETDFLRWIQAHRA
jgi:cytochrome c oxidase subunit 2